LLVKVMVIVFFIVRIYYPKNAICQGFCPDFAYMILFGL
jgi:hypothetical protein